MSKKLVFILIALALLIAPVSADRYVNYVVKEGIISGDGVFSATSNPVSNYNVIGFVCLDSGCNSVGSSLWEGQVLNSGDDAIQLSYPATLQSSYGYAVYFYKEGYIPWEQNPNWWGSDSSDPQGPYTKYLSKKQGCHAPIDSLSVVNSVIPYIPLVINVAASIDAETYSAIHSAGPLGYVPPQLEEHYSVKTKVTLEVYDFNNELVYSDYKSMTIPYSGSQEVEFEWTPTQVGKHTIIVYTDITDAKCSSYTQESTSKQTHVISDAPQNICYTILNNLETSEQFPMQGNIIKITADKISNYADDNYQLTPVPTGIDLKITRQSDSAVVDFQSLSLATNPNYVNPVGFEFEWDASLIKSGWYNIEVEGIASSNLCSGITNNPETISETIFLSNNPDIKPIAIVTANPLSGYAPLKVNFTCEGSGGIIPYTYFWDFGDSLSSNAQDPTHIYISDGTYTAKCTVTDADNDKGSSSITISVLKMPQSCTDNDEDGYSITGGICGVIDCNDNNKNIHPGATEICGNGIDENCDGADLTCALTCTDNDDDGYSIESGECGLIDCNDNNYNVNPGAVEICDNKDNDCDGSIDEGAVCKGGDNNHKKTKDAKAKLLIACNPVWECSDWSECYDNVKTRNCIDLNMCEDLVLFDSDKPAEKIGCDEAQPSILKDSITAASKEKNTAIILLIAGAILLIVLTLLLIRAR